jgi:glycosyltransferase involved in cell wall biosynthesis
VRICLVSREVAPFGGGGIGVYVTALARLLSRIADVTVITVDEHAGAHAALAGDPALPPGVRFHFAAAPDQWSVAHSFGYHHAWSAAVLDAVVELYGDAGPDLIEVPDYHAEGFVLVQAKRSGHPTLEQTRIVVRAHTTWEQCALLDGHVPVSREERALRAMERYVLRHADHLLWAGGDILGTYERYYGPGALAPPVRVRHPIPPAAAPALPGAAPRAGGPLAFAYVARLERRKGVLDLVRAFQRHPGDDWRLTLIGGDTASGPGDASMRTTLELMTLGDERITFTGALPRDETLAVLRAHDALVMPSRWECWPYAVLEAMQAGLPVLATAAGGHFELVDDGVTGRLVPPGVDAIADALGRLLARPGELRALGRGGAPARRCAELTAEEPILAAYAELAQPSVQARPGRRRRPLVSVVIPYKGLAEHVGDALASLDAQTYPNLEVIVVDDGALDVRDGVLDTLGSRHRLRVLHQVNRGLGGARNAGIAVSEGRYVFPLDADNMAEPTFVARCVALLDDDPALAYVTSWTRYVDAADRDVVEDVVVGFRPLGNFDPLVEEHNIAGDAAAVWPRRLFDRGLRYSEAVPVIEDWTLYRRMWRTGLHGHVIPERLIRYRVRPDSMLRGDAVGMDALAAQATAELNREEVAWTPSIA